MARRTIDEELAFISSSGLCQYRIEVGFVPHMRVPGLVFVNPALHELLVEELREHVGARGVGGFLPAVKQVANVAGLPGIVGQSIALPDVHSGYGFAIGNVAAFDMDDPTAIVSPGGVGFDINCGVRLLRTNLFEADVEPVKDQLAQAMFDHIPVGVGTSGLIPATTADLEVGAGQGGPSYK